MRKRTGMGKEKTGIGEGDRRERNEDRESSDNGEEDDITDSCDFTFPYLT